MNASRLLVSALLYALAAAGLAALVRKLPFWPARWLDRKPLGCIVCMAGWSALVLIAGSYLVHEEWPRYETLLLWFAAMGGATYILTQSGVFADPLDDLLTEREVEGLPPLRDDDERRTP